MTTNKYFAKRPLAIAMSSLLMGLTTLSLHAQETPAPIDETEVIEVKGFRGSLNKSLLTKRAAVNSVESIAAEDIGKFPDLNIAESIQRVPGVAISREGGEGRQITLRGLGPSFTRTTLNGMEVPSSTDGTDSGGGVNGSRAFDFNVFASELFNRVDIQKNPTASMEEGGIAGTVDLYTARPFDSPGLHLTATAQGGYNDVTTKTDPRLAFMVSNTFADDTVGVLFSVARSDRTVRQEGFGTVRWTTPALDGGGIFADTSNTVVTGTPDVGDCQSGGESVDPVNCLWTPRLPRPDFFGNKQERLGFTGSFQYAPNDDLLISFDTLHSTLENTRTMYNFFEMFRSTFDEITPTAITVHPNGQQVLAGAYSGVKSRIESRLQASETDFSQYVLTGEYQLNDSLTINAMLGTAESDARSEQYRYNMTNSTAHTFSFDFTENENAPVVNYGYDVNDASFYDLSDGRLRATDVLRQNDTAKIDVIYEGDEVTLKTGYAYNDRTVTYSEEQINGFPDQSSAVGFSEPMPFDDFGSGFDGPLSSFIVADFDAIDAQLLNKTWTPRGAQSWEVEEQTDAFYLELNSVYDLADMTLRTNFGFRYVETQTTSSGFIQNDAITIENEYKNFLPAMNLALEVTRELTTRLSVTKSMTRPSLGSLNPGNPSFSYINGTVSSGNPFLDPFTANNVDFSLEWYFNEESLVAATVFYKDIETFIISSSEEKLVDTAYLPFIDADPQYDPLIALDPRTVEYTHNTPINGEGTSVHGFELIYQQPFSFLPEPFDGFGTVANYTRVSSGEITGLSKNSYNLTFYYEKDNYGARISANKRDDYITSYSGGNGNAEEGTTGPTHVDLSAFYNFNDNLTFTFEVVNLTDEYERLYTTGDGTLNLMREYNHTGTQYFLGARYTL
ncbi:MAG: TonB-dependent receptor [Paraglaciecola sp.]|uniref:TonB-dependent receptor n=1 Tax=Paraglaciecola sp. TaxID=1920173 RepID=UPI00273F49E1|nr:TonB-dependent receptor [Paraglaciecola sp.]MDP5031112.1 TonB-dependent receptor [Paraglaciecola sp.]MDP5132422.1 TonB-dependent receptor [Paraglaciecola sp.]